MSNSNFPKMLDYEKLKQQFGEQHPIQGHHQIKEQHQDIDETAFHKPLSDDETENTPKPQGLTGTRLRSYAFAVLTRREYSKADLIEKLITYAQDRDEVIHLVEELAQNNYQSDQRVAEMTVRSQMRKGKGPNRIKLALRSKQLDKALVQEDLAEIDWYEQAYQLKVKKYGAEVAKDPKIKAKQIRFLQYRGFEMDAIMKAISKKESD
ncbi:MAG: regulatory protein RecX [Acinetobacter sp.]